MRSITLLKVHVKLSREKKNEKKIQKFWTAPKKKNKISKPVLLKSTVHNLSLHNLTEKEYEAV